MKKELLIASLLAIGLAVALGTFSFGFFAEPPAGTLETVIDVYTLTGGVGVNTTGGTFEPGDTAYICAHLTAGGVSVNNSRITFIIKRPDGMESVKTALTNGSGVAEISLSFLPSEGHLIGMWQMLASASPNNKAVTDSMQLQCAAESAWIDVLAEKNGAVSLSFLPSDEVFLEARLSYRNTSIAGAPVTFEVRTPNDTDFFLPAQKTVITDTFGVANVTFQIPWPSDISLGTWHVAAASQIYEQVVNATTNFNCRILEPTIDVYTQKGGRGQNAQGGTFVLNETLFICAEIRDSLNKTVFSQFVGFDFKCYSITSVPYDFSLSNGTDASGIAGIITRIPSPPEYAGAWSVQAIVHYQDGVLTDTVSFVVNQQ